jgi:hypothetical protein
MELPGDWKRRLALKKPEGVKSLRALTGDEMRAWQVVAVQPHTQYTVNMDYRINREFHGIVRPTVRGDDGAVLADAGWTSGHFQEIQDLRTIHGSSRLRISLLNDGHARLCQEISVPRNRFLELRADVEIDGKGPATAFLECVDAETNKALGVSELDLPGRSELTFRFVSPSERARVRLGGRGSSADVFFDNLELSNPVMTPPLQQAEWADASEAFRISDTLSYEVAAGDKDAIEGALWLFRRDLSGLAVEIAEASSDADVSISIGSFRVRGEEGYRLRVTTDGVTIDAATPRAAQFALMSLVQLPRVHNGVWVIPSVEIVDWPDMPLRGVTLGVNYLHIMPEEIDDPPEFHDDMYFADLLQMARWKMNFLLWRNRWSNLTEKQESQTEALVRQCARFHIDVSGFVSTLSDAPGSMLALDPNLIEGLHVEREMLTLDGLESTNLLHPNVIRTDAADIEVFSADGKTIFEIGRDFRVVGSLGTFDEANDRFVRNETFGVGRMAGSRIPDGATVAVSYDHVGKVGPHVQYCPSDPKAVDYVGDGVHKIVSRWRPKYLMIRADEISRVNSNRRCRRRDKAPSQILLEHHSFVRDRIQEGSPETQVVMWEDSFSPYHGGRRWGFTEDGPAPPKDIWQFVWFYDPNDAATRGWESLKHFEKQGLTTVVCPCFKLQNIREWAQVVGEARARGWSCRGMVDMTWSQPPPYANVRETAIVSWRAPKPGDRRWLYFEPGE